VDIIRTTYYIQGALGDENIFDVLYVSLCYGLLHIVIKQQFFTFQFKCNDTVIQHTNFTPRKNEHFDIWIAFVHGHIQELPLCKSILFLTHAVYNFNAGFLCLL